MQMLSIKRVQSSLQTRREDMDFGHSNEGQSAFEETVCIHNERARLPCFWGSLEALQPL